MGRFLVAVKKFQDKFASLRQKTAPLAKISLKYVELTLLFLPCGFFVNFVDLHEFRCSATVRNFRSPVRKGSNSGFSFCGSCELLLRPLQSRHCKLRSRVCCVVKHYYNSPHIFYGKVQSNNPRWKTFVRPKTGCVRAKIGLTGQLDRRQPRNYLKPCITTS